MTTKLIKAFSYLFSIPIYLMVFFVPKSPKIWVFGAWFGNKFSDNPKAVFDYMSKNYCDIDAVWIVKNSSLAQELKKKGIRALKATSFTGMWYQARAGVVIYTHSVQAEFCSFFVSGRTKKVYLWHGTPLKRIGYDGELSPISALENIIKTFFFRFLLFRHDLVCAASSDVADIYCRAFLVPRSKVVVTGSATSDFVIASINKKNIEKKYHSILYAPTFRNGKWQEFDFFGPYIQHIAKLDKRLGEENIRLGVRPHPVNKLTESTMSNIKASENIYFEDVDELNDHIWKYDALITDFSGVMFDFALLQRPIYFMPLDIEEYLSKERKLYVDYDEFTKGHTLNGWQDLENNLSAIANQLRHGTAPINTQVSTYGVKYYDGNNSARVVQAIIKLLSGDITND